MTPGANMAVRCLRKEVISMLYRMSFAKSRKRTYWALIKDKIQCKKIAIAAPAVHSQFYDGGLDSDPQFF